jgi:predicted dehydrogenase
MIWVRDGERTVHDVSSPLLEWTSQPWHVAQESVLNTQRHFADCLARGVPAETSGEDNLKTYALVMAAYESAATGQTVRPMGRSAA